MQVPNIWLRPQNQRREADAAKALLSVPDGDHLTLLNVYNNYIQSMSPSLIHFFYLIVRFRLSYQELDLGQLYLGAGIIASG